MPNIEQEILLTEVETMAEAWLKQFNAVYEQMPVNAKWGKYVNSATTGISGYIPEEYESEFNEIFDRVKSEFRYEIKDLTQLTVEQLQTAKTLLTTMQNYVAEAWVMMTQKIDRAIVADLAELKIEPQTDAQLKPPAKDATSRENTPVKTSEKITGMWNLSKLTGLFSTRGKNPVKEEDRSMFADLEIDGQYKDDSNLKPGGKGARLK